MKAKTTAMVACWATMWVSCHDTEEEFEFPVVTGAIAESNAALSLDATTAGATRDTTLLAGNRFAPFLFETRGAASIAASVTFTGGGTAGVRGAVTGGIRGGMAVYGPRRGTARFGIAVARAVGAGGASLSIDLTDGGTYLILIGRMPMMDASPFTLTLSCTGDGCGRPRPYCATPSCVVDCPSGFAEDQYGCPTCACNDQFTCTQDGDCARGEKCAAGQCVSCGCETAPFSPVCDTNGRRYRNLCDLQCRGATEGTCPALSCSANGGNCPAGMLCLSGTCAVDEACINACPTGGEAVCGVVGARPETFRNGCVLRCVRGEILAPGPCRRGCETDVVECRGVACRFGLKRRTNGCLTCECRTAPSCALDSDCGPGAVCEGGSCATCDGCRALPAGPLCGSDGREYRNDAERRCRQGLSPVAGQCGPGTACNVACGQSSDCANPAVGGLGMTLACVSGFCRDTACSTSSGPICGTDGVTYANECAVPWCRGVRKRASGQCPSGPLSTDCPVLAPGQGTQWVCGENGRTFQCAQKALAAGVAIRHPGPCCPPNREDVCVSNIGCAAGFECKSNRCVPIGCDESRPVAGSDGRTYASECAIPYCRDITKKRRAMLCSDVVRPVCGTDGATYRNVCELLTARAVDNPGLGVRHPGVCLPATNCTYSAVYDPYCTNFGTVENLSVAACIRSVCVSSTCADVQILSRGVCPGSRSGCPTTVSPVCGGDGRTYGNVCLAQQNGVASFTPGTCANQADAGQ